MSSSQALISIIIPAYNVELYLEQSIRSVLDQSFQRFELIVINDGSTDGTGNIANDWAAQDSRITVLNQENSGQGCGRNNGIANSSAPYIMFLDADDFYAPTMCEKLYEAINSTNADMAICGVTCVYDTDQFMQAADEKLYSISKTGLHAASQADKLQMMISPCTKIYRRSIIEQHDIYYPVHYRYEDNFFHHAYTAWAKNIFYIDEPLYHRRRREGSVMNLTAAKQCNYVNDHFLVYIYIYEYFKKKNLLDSHQNYVREIFKKSLYFCLANAATKATKEDLLKICTQFIKTEAETTHSCNAYTAYKKSIFEPLAKDIRKEKLKIQIPLVRQILDFKNFIKKLTHK